MLHSNISNSCRPKDEIHGPYFLLPDAFRWGAAMKIPLRNLSIACSGLLYLLAHLQSGLWKDPGNIIRSDVADYYAYLPACFVYHDLSLRFIDRIPEPAADGIARIPQDNGNYAIKMSMGLAMMYAPFFLLGHAVATHSSAYAANGYSLPYGVALIAGAFFYFLLGLYWLGRALSTFFSDRTVALVLFLLAWATNATYYLLREPAMSHGFSFCLFAAFLCLTMAWHRRQAWATTVLLGLTYGLITLVRPTNGVIALVFMLWDVGSFSDLKRKAAFFLRHGRAIALIGVLALLVWAPQFLYWKTVTGHWLHYSYVDEGFFFLHPRIWEVLFGFRKGWLVYTPAMGFALLGFPLLYRVNRSLFWSSFVFLLVNIYVVSSWWCWWYGGSYGQRAFIESYVVLAFPLAALAQWALDKGRFAAGAALGVALLLVLHNFFQLLQLKTGTLHMENMTRAAYFKTWGHVRPTPEYYSLLRTPDFDAARAGRPESDWKRRP